MSTSGLRGPYLTLTVRLIREIAPTVFTQDMKGYDLNAMTYDSYHDIYVLLFKKRNY